MNASQNNFPKSRRFTFVALALGVLSAGAVSVALLQVDALERDYGAIRADVQRYNTERTEALGRRDDVLSEISQRSVEADGVRKTIAVLNAQRDRLSAEIKQQTESLSDGSEKLRVSQEQAKAAAETIAEAEAAQKTLVSLRSQNADLQKAIAANQSKIDQSNSDIAQAQDRKATADAAAAASEKLRRDRDAEVAKLNQQLQDLDERQRQVADLTAQQTALTSQITRLTKEISDKQRTSQDLDATIAKQQDQASKAKIAGAKTDADIARQESNRAELANQVSVLETKKASLNGDLASLTASADRARADAAAAEGRLKVAQDGLAESQKALPSAKAELTDVQADLAAAIIQRDSVKLEVTSLQALRAKNSIEKADVDRASAEKVTLETAVTDLQSKQAQLAKELELKRNELTSVRDELANLSGRKGVLTQEITTLNEAKASNVSALSAFPPPAVQSAPEAVQSPQP